MNGIDIATITRTNRINNRPRLDFYAGWMEAMGFVHGALVQLIPGQGGMTFTLYNENIRSYSELHRSTKERGGTLIHVYLYRDGLNFCVSGMPLNDAGLAWGDRLLVRYKYGLVRMRKLPPGEATLTTLRVAGKWLAKSGFVPDEVLTVNAIPGCITCELQPNGVERTAELVKYARANKLQLVQVRKQTHKLRNPPYKHGAIQWFDIPHTCLENAGFITGEPLIATYKYGSITLQKPNFTEAGF